MSDQQSSTNTMRRPVMTPQQKRAQILLAACYLVAIVLGLVNGLWGSQFWQTAGQFNQPLEGIRKDLQAHDFLYAVHDGSCG